MPAVLPIGRGKVPLDRLHEAPDNPRTISEERFEALKHALKTAPEMMEDRPIIATVTGEIVGGNMRYRAAQALGWTEIETSVRQLTDNEKREWRLRDNNGYGDWVPDELANELLALKAAEGDLAMTGFRQEEVDAILADAAASQRPDEDVNFAANPNPPEIWGIVVECETERDQTELLERLAGEGRAVRALL